MSRLSLFSTNEAQQTVEELYKDLERRIQAAQPGLCPVDLAATFLHLSHSQSCGKCIPCRVGLGQLEKLIGSVLIMEYESREQLDDYLANEPYVKANVWDDIRVEKINVVIANGK